MSGARKTGLWVTCLPSLPGTGEFTEKRTLQEDVQRTEDVVKLTEPRL